MLSRRTWKALDFDSNLRQRGVISSTSGLIVDMNKMSKQAKKWGISVRGNDEPGNHKVVFLYKRDTKEKHWE
jgi:hypothetical protein